MIKPKINPGVKYFVFFQFAINVQGDKKQLVFIVCVTLYMEDKIFNLCILFKRKTVFLKSIKNTHQGLNRYGMRNIIMN